MTREQEARVLKLAVDYQIGDINTREFGQRIRAMVTEPEPPKVRRVRLWVYEGNNSIQYLMTTPHGETLPDGAQPVEVIPWEDPRYCRGCGWEDCKCRK